MANVLSFSEKMWVLENAYRRYDAIEKLGREISQRSSQYTVISYQERTRAERGRLCKLIERLQSEVDAYVDAALS